MNKPSAEELCKIMGLFGNGGIERCENLLDRYHVIDKTEPVEGANDSTAIIEKAKGRLVELEHKEFDGRSFTSGFVEGYVENIGTVARLTGEVERLGVIKDEYTRSIHELQAEVDRLKIEDKLFDDIAKKCEELEDEVDRLNSLLKERNQRELEKALKKPEAVGCGKEFNIENYKTIGRTYLVCGKNDDLCHDCQAKANYPETPDSSPIEQVGRSYKRVQLPEVPNVELGFKDWHKKAEAFMLAVKAHLEGEDGR